MAYVSMPPPATFSFYMNDFSLEVARKAAGSIVSMCNQVHSGRLHNGLCLVRPPGNLATASSGAGCCIFNNVAIGAATLKKLGYKRIMIVDIDVHAAAGTSQIFEADPSVLVCSLHQGSPTFYTQNTGQAWAKKTGSEHMGVGEGRICGRFGGKRDDRERAWYDADEEHQRHVEGREVFASPAAQGKLATYFERQWMEGLPRAGAGRTLITRDDVVNATLEREPKESAAAPRRAKECFEVPYALLDRHVRKDVRKWGEKGQAFEDTEGRASVGS